jgi:polyhydroxyalkanoate synthase
MELMDKAKRKSGRLLAHFVAAAASPDCSPCIQPLPGDNPPRAKEWQERPYSFLTQAFLLNQQWWHNVTHEVPGLTPHHEDMVSFVTRQFLDLFSPSNSPFPILR